VGRIVNTNSPGKIRNRHRRTVAELLRRLSQRQVVDEETKDLVAAIIFALRGIHVSVLQTVEAWEKRDFWTKADRFLRQWEWTLPLAQTLEESLHRDEWSELPQTMASLMPHFVDIEMKKMTRPPSLWQGAYRRFLANSETASGDRT
jgi:hypothetical protein